MYTAEGATSVIVVVVELLVESVTVRVTVDEASPPAVRDEGGAYVAVALLDAAWVNVP